MDAKKWYEKAGADGDIVCSTRIRLARNLKQYSFGGKTTSEQRKEICEKAQNALMAAGSVISEQFNYVELDALSEEQAVSLAEKHLISPEFISEPYERAVLLSRDESISIMINEEDHIRIQVIKEGFDLKEAFETADRIDTLLGERLDFAFDDEFGFLTHCPTNLGTGMRASVMLHLPAMSEQGMIQRVAANLSKLGMTIRGTYGEGSKVYGALYQLSNQITLGLSENDAIGNLQSVTKQLIVEERKLRTRMKNDISAQDKVGRSAGILKTAKILRSYELMELLSNIRLGLSLGLLQGITHEDVNRLMTISQPATLMAAQDKKMTQSERDILRAKLARTFCRNIKE